MASLLIALDESPGVSPIAIGEVLRRLIAKCVLSVANGEAQKALWGATTRMLIDDSGKYP